MLRRDSLALLLALSNAQPSARVIILEGALGLLTGSIAQRLGGQGLVLAVHPQKPTLDALQWLNPTPQVVGSVRSCSLADILRWVAIKGATPLSEGLWDEAAAAQLNTPRLIAHSALGIETATGGNVANGGEEEGTGIEGKQLADLRDMEVMGEDNFSDARGDRVATAAAGRKRPADGLLGSAPTDEAQVSDATLPSARQRVSALQQCELDMMLGAGFSSLVVATRDAPLTALPELLSLLRPGGVFAVYHHSMQPLADCLHACQRRKLAVRLQLIEPWTRNYQVAPNRTHPMMTAHPPTGYVLSGVKVIA